MLLRNGFTWDQTGLYVYMAFEFKESDSSSLEHRWVQMALSWQVLFYIGVLNGWVTLSNPEPQFSHKRKQLAACHASKTFQWRQLLHKKEPVYHRLTLPLT